jgi:hypothetical protein
VLSQLLSACCVLGVVPILRQHTFCVNTLFLLIPAEVLDVVQQEQKWRPVP